MTEKASEWPKLTEVEPPCLASKFCALSVGSTELIKKWIEKLEDEPLSFDNFSACWEILPQFVADPVLFLIRAGILDRVTYVEAQEAYVEMLNAPDAVSESNREVVVQSLMSYLDEAHEQELVSFHKRFDSLTVFITDDGRIAIGRYSEE